MLLVKYKYWAVLSACCISGSILSFYARAESDEGLTTFVQSQYIHESNLFRLSGRENNTFQAGAPSEGLLRLGLGLSYSKQLGLQSLDIGAEVNRDSYDEFDFLDHTSGSLEANWQWGIGQRWGGGIRGGYERRIQDFTESRSSELDHRNIYSVRFDLGYSFTTHWRFRSAISYRDQQHDLDERDSLNRSTTQLITELRYTSPKRSFIGFRVSLSDADFPNEDLISSVPVDNSYQQIDSGFTVNWRLSAKSALRARMGLAGRQYDSFSDRDFSGITWRGEYDWKPRERYRVGASVWRDLEAYSDLVTSYVVESGIETKAEWLVTPKSSMSLVMAVQQRDYDGDPNFVDALGPVRSDDVISYGVQGLYDATHSLQLTVGYDYEKRDSNIQRWDYDCYTVTFGIKASF